MADTEDVSYVLLEFLLGGIHPNIIKELKQKDGMMSLWSVDLKRIRERLEWLSEDQRIGIEDARKLLYLGREQANQAQPPEEE